MAYRVTDSTQSRVSARVRGPRPPIAHPREAEIQRTSLFLITANTNYAPRNDDDAQRVADELHRAIYDTLNDEVVRRRMIKIRNGATLTPAQHNLVDSVHLMAAHAEVGHDKGFVHAHAVVEVKHRVPNPGIHLNPLYLRQEIRRKGFEPEVENLPYLHINGTSPREDLMDYVRKGHRVKGRQLATLNEIDAVPDS